LPAALARTVFKSSRTSPEHRREFYHRVPTGSR
jgi:hypothetical protein